MITNITGLSTSVFFNLLGHPGWESLVYVHVFNDMNIYEVKDIFSEITMQNTDKFVNSMITGISEPSICVCYNRDVVFTVNIYLIK